MTEGRGAFGGFIGPRTLLAQVEATAPWLRGGEGPPARGGRLHESAAQPHGWWAILGAADRLSATRHPTPEEWTDYFALCVAAHFATVATYVPTDVDTKIRLHLWHREMPEEERARLRALALGLAHWDVRPVTARLIDVAGHGPVSGHDGERLSVLCGGLVGHLAIGDAGASELEEAVDAELAREAAAFDALAALPGQEIELLQLAALLTHNAGDVDQGLSAREGRGVAEAVRARFGRLAHEGPQRYGGSFARAARLTREMMAPDGHRHYPLREVRRLRSHPGLLLPLAPFLDAWGARVANWPGWDDRARGEVVAGLVEGVLKVKGQHGYQRALAGMDTALRRGLAGLEDVLPVRIQKALREPGLRREIAVSRASFEASFAKRARAALR